MKIKPDDLQSFLDEPLQYNYNLTTGNQVIVNMEWRENNINTIRDLLENDGITFIDFQTFKTKYVNTPKTNFLNFNGIIRTARMFITKVKNNINNNMKCSFWVWEKIYSGNKDVKETIDNDNNPPTATLKWDTFFPDLNWTVIFIKCFKTTIDTQMQWFQARILHRILPTRKYLNTCKIANSSICLQCNDQVETLCHLFWECKFAHKFWLDLEELLVTNCYNCARFKFNLELVVFGTSKNIITDKAIDFLILFAKFYIYKCRFLDTTPNCLSFISCLKNRLRIERTLSLKRNKYIQFQMLWLPYNCIFENTVMH